MKVQWQVRPTWRRDFGGVQGAQSLVLPDLETYLEALLELAEEIVAEGVKSRPVHKHLQVYEIPEKQRDPRNPARLKVSLDEFLSKRLHEAAAKEAHT